MLCDHAYKASDILAMEGDILSTVGFGLLVSDSALYHL